MKHHTQTKQHKTQANDNYPRARTTNSTSNAIGTCPEALQSSQQLNNNKPSPNPKEIAIKTMHTTTMCNDTTRDKCDTKRQVEMRVTGKRLAYLVEFTSSKKKQVLLLCNALLAKVEGCRCVALSNFCEAT
jgi:hypothetical protein